jgi:hypothetical protein
MSDGLAVFPLHMQSSFSVNLLEESISLFAALAMLGALSMPAAVGTLRIADALGLAIDRGIVDDGVYFRVTNTFYASVGIRFASSELSVGYTLRLGPDPQTLGVAQFHIAELRYAYTARRLSFTASETFGLGEQVFLGVGRASPLAGVMREQDAAAAPVGPTLAVTAPLDTRLLPAAQVLPIVIQRADAGLSYRIDRQWTTTFALGYSTYGGLTREAQQDFALIHTLIGSATAASKLDARNDLTTGLQLAHGWNARQESFAYAVLSETWQHRLSKQTKLELGAGLSVRETDQPVGPRVIVTTPVGTVGLEHTMRARDLTGALRFGLAFVPMVDVVSARLQNRFTATATATLGYDDLYAGAGFALSQAVPTDDPYAVRYIHGNVFSGYRLTPWLGASLSAVVTRQWLGSTVSGPSAYTASGLTWGVYGGLDATFSVQRF